jgi:UDP-2-acetamido-2-deoxy-ribo-hexuluronate aminotransferase
MADLRGQYEKVKNYIDKAILNVVETTIVINGPEVENFEYNLQEYLNINKVISCANSTDVLQLALMASNLKAEN